LGEGDGDGDYMSRADCARVSGKINLALFGADGRGGMEADIKKILQKTSYLEEQVKKNGSLKVEDKKINVTRLGIIVSFISGLIGAAVAVFIAFVT